MNKAQKRTWIRLLICVVTLLAAATLIVYFRRWNRHLRFQYAGKDQTLCAPGNPLGRSPDPDNSRRLGVEESLR